MSRGDGSVDERQGVDAARSAARSGSETIDDCGGGAAAGARTPSSVPAVEGLPDRGSNRVNLVATRSSQQPMQAGAAKESALAIIREWYWDFGPTLVAEKLREVHGITLGRETLRLWRIDAGLWLDRKQRQKRVNQPRSRRDCVGELVQLDGSEHWWFEDRGPQCTLLVFVDDATGRLMHLEFVESESTFAYFRATRSYLQAWGKPIAFYGDKHGDFRGQPSRRPWR